MRARFFYCFVGSMSAALLAGEGFWADSFFVFVTLKLRLFTIAFGRCDSVLTKF